MAIARIRQTAPNAVDSAVALEELNDPHSLAVHALSPGACVLDVGCGTGAVAQRLVERGCRVFGIDVDPACVAAAKAYCDEAVVGDVETLDWEHAFPSIHFDAILFLDVLEHLRDPVRILRRAQHRLKQDGRILASIPNVAHGAVRLQLLGGHFRYVESGLLDRGHLRFFDRDAVERLFADAGCRITEQARITRGLMETEISIDLERVPTDLLDSLEKDADALTYQFFVVAARRAERVKPEAAPEQSLVEAHRTQIRALVRLVRDGESYTKKIEAELEGKQQEIGRFEAELAAHAAARAELEESVRRGEEGIAYTRKIEEELARKESHIAQLEQSARQHEETAEYARKVEDELGRKQQQITRLEAELHTVTAVGAEREAALRERTADLRDRLTELEGAREERVCLERELVIQNEYVSELRTEMHRADERLRGLEAEIHGLRAAERAVAQEAEALRAALCAALGRVTELEDFAQQPRHLLSERFNSWMKRDVPTIHRLLRPFVLSRWRRWKESGQRGPD